MPSVIDQEMEYYRLQGLDTVGKSIADLRAEFFAGGGLAEHLENLTMAPEGDGPPIVPSWGSNSNPTSGTLYLAYFVANKTRTVTKLVSFTTTTAAAATPTLCRMGLYEAPTTAVWGDNPALTLIGSHANDTAMWNTTFTKYSKAMAAPASAQLTKGRIYATAAIIVTATTVPNLKGVFTAGGTPESTFFKGYLRRLTGQTDLPASIGAGTASDHNQGVYVAVTE